MSTERRGGQPERISTILPRVLDQLAEDIGRAHALEVLLVAHVALDRQCLSGRSKPDVSAPANRLLEYLRATPPGVPFAAADACAFHALLTDRRLGPVVAFAEEVERVTVAELSFLSRDTVLRCLGSLPNTSTDRLLDTAEATAA